MSEFYSVLYRMYGGRALGWVLAGLSVYIIGVCCFNFSAILLSTNSRIQLWMDGLAYKYPRFRHAQKIIWMYGDIWDTLARKLISTSAPDEIYFRQSVRKLSQRPSAEVSRLLSKLGHVPALSRESAAAAAAAVEEHQKLYQPVGVGTSD